MAPRDTSPCGHDDNRNAHFDLSPSQQAPHEARVKATRTLLHWGLSHLVEDVTTCLSELVTNAIREATEISVLVEWRNETNLLEIAVRDNAPGRPQVRQPDPSSEGGRGLFIVACLAKEWGHDVEQEDQKIVWARFAAP